MPVAHNTKINSWLDLKSETEIKDLTNDDLYKAFPKIPQNSARRIKNTWMKKRAQGDPPDRDHTTHHNKSPRIPPAPPPSGGSTSIIKPVNNELEEIASIMQFFKDKELRASFGEVVNYKDKTDQLKKEQQTEETIIESCKRLTNEALLSIIMPESSLQPEDSILLSSSELSNSLTNLKVGNTDSLL